MLFDITHLLWIATIGESLAARMGMFALIPVIGHELLEAILSPKGFGHH
jgi:hypothetical protein